MGKSKTSKASKQQADDTTQGAPINATAPSGETPMFMSVPAASVEALDDAAVLALAPVEIAEIQSAQASFELGTIDLNDGDAVHALIVNYRRRLASGVVFLSSPECEKAYTDAVRQDHLASTPGQGVDLPPAETGQKSSEEWEAGKRDPMSDHEIDHAVIEIGTHWNPENGPAPTAAELRTLEALVPDKPFETADEVVAFILKHRTPVVPSTSTSTGSGYSHNPKEPRPTPTPGSAAGYSNHKS